VLSYSTYLGGNSDDVGNGKEMNGRISPAAASSLHPPPFAALSRIVTLFGSSMTAKSGKPSPLNWPTTTPQPGTARRIAAGRASDWAPTGLGKAKRLLHGRRAGTPCGVPGLQKEVKLDEA
jgi:hypothetical protein